MLNFHCGAQMLGLMRKYLTDFGCDPFLNLLIRFHKNWVKNTQPIGGSISGVPGLEPHFFSEHFLKSREIAEN